MKIIKNFGIDENNNTRDYDLWSGEKTWTKNI